jgi:sarcosine oxidase
MMKQIDEYRYAVVGLGAIGSAAAYWLARRAGPQVIGLEQYELGHTRGASEDHSRIIRRSYHTPSYVRLAGEAYEAWREVERDAGERLIVRTGGLDLWREGAAVATRDYTASMAACGVPYEELDAAETMRRWPQWRLDDDIRAVYQEDAGIAPASKCNATHRRLAIAHGAVLCDHTPVTAISEAGGEIVIEAGERRLRCEKLVVAADAWTNQILAHFGLGLPLTIMLQQVTYFAAPAPAEFAPDRFPIWIWMDDACFYGFPTYGEAGPKVAQDAGGPEVSSPEKPDVPDQDMRRRVHRFVRERLPRAFGPEIFTRTCLYTLPPDRDFVLDHVPGHENVLVALGAGHGFKFSSLFGRIVSQLAIEGGTPHDISPFAADRPTLTMKDAPKRFLI